MFQGIHSLLKKLAAVLSHHSNPGDTRSVAKGIGDYLKSGFREELVDEVQIERLLNSATRKYPPNMGFEIIEDIGNRVVSTKKDPAPAEGKQVSAWRMGIGYKLFQTLKGIFATKFMGQGIEDNEEAAEKILMNGILKGDDIGLYRDHKEQMVKLLASNLLKFFEGFASNKYHELIKDPEFTDTFPIVDDKDKSKSEENDTDDEEQPAEDEPRRVTVKEIEKEQEETEDDVDKTVSPAGGLKKVDFSDVKKFISEKADPSERAMLEKVTERMWEAIKKGEKPSYLDIALEIAKNQGLDFDYATPRDKWGPKEFNRLMNFKQKKVIEPWQNFLRKYLKEEAPAGEKKPEAPGEKKPERERKHHLDYESLSDEDFKDFKDYLRRNIKLKKNEERIMNMVEKLHKGESTRDETDPKGSFKHRNIDPIFSEWLKLNKPQEVAVKALSRIKCAVMYLMSVKKVVDPYEEYLTETNPDVFKDEPKKPSKKTPEEKPESKSEEDDRKLRAVLGMMLHRRNPAPFRFTAEFESDFDMTEVEPVRVYKRDEMKPWEGEWTPLEKKNDEKYHPMVEGEKGEWSKDGDNPNFKWTKIIVDMNFKRNNYEVKYQLVSERKPDGSMSGKHTSELSVMKKGEEMSDDSLKKFVDEYFIGDDGILKSPFIGTKNKEVNGISITYKNTKLNRTYHSIKDFEHYMGGLAEPDSHFADKLRMHEEFKEKVKQKGKPIPVRDVPTLKIRLHNMALNKDKSYTPEEAVKAAHYEELIKKVDEEKPSLGDKDLLQEINVWIKGVLARIRTDRDKAKGRI